MVSTLGKVSNNLFGKRGLNLKNLRCLIIDEADVYFKNDRDFADIKRIISHRDLAERTNNPLQYILFSATLHGPDPNSEEVLDRISKVIPEAILIKVDRSKLCLDNVKQFEY